jgi:hypothetical protein
LWITSKPPEILSPKKYKTYSILPQEKPVSQEISSFLLNIREIGQQDSERFTQQCKKDPIPKIKVSIPS